MSDPVQLAPGHTYVKDPADERTLTWNWDDLLAAGVEISTSTFTISLIKGDNMTPLTKDNEVILAGNRKAFLRIKAGTLGSIYGLAHKIVTNENPTQTIEKSIQVKVTEQ